MISGFLTSSAMAFKEDEPKETSLQKKLQIKNRDQKPKQTPKIEIKKIKNPKQAPKTEIRNHIGQEGE